MKSPSRAPLRMSGFSLLEVILALGLTSLLLAAVYSALQMHWTYSTLGQVEMERSQIARALFRRIETDLRGVVLPQASASSSSDTSTDTSTSSSSSSSSSTTSGSTSSSSTSSGTSSTSTSSGTSGTSSSSASGTTSQTGTDTTTTAQKAGVSGDAISLIVYSSLPSRVTSGLATTGSNTAANNSSMAGFSSDLQSVAYFLMGSGSSLAQQLSSNTGTTANGKPITGLARMQGDRLTMAQADQNGDLSSLASRVQLLAPEVASIEFEYYDGVSWSTSWDTATSNLVPNAVRVTIQFQPPEQVRGGWFARPINPSSNRYQQVIAIPHAEPYVDSSLTTSTSTGTTN